MNKQDNLPHLILDVPLKEVGIIVFDYLRSGAIFFQIEEQKENKMIFDIVFFYERPL